MGVGPIEPAVEFLRAAWAVAPREEVTLARDQTRGRG